MDICQYKVKKQSKLYSSFQSELKTRNLSISEKKKKTNLSSNRYIQERGNEINEKSSQNRSTDSIRIHKLKKSALQQERKNRLFTLQYDEQEEIASKQVTNAKNIFLNKLNQLKYQLQKIHGSSIDSFCHLQTKRYSKKFQLLKMKQTSLKITIRFLNKKLKQLQMSAFINIIKSSPIKICDIYDL